LAEDAVKLAGDTAIAIEIEIEDRLVNIRESKRGQGLGSLARHKLSVPSLARGRFHEADK
jgi:hypothetical protein